MPALPALPQAPQPLPPKPSPRPPAPRPHGRSGRRDRTAARRRLCPWRRGRARAAAQSRQAASSCCRYRGRRRRHGRARPLAAALHGRPVALRRRAHLQEGRTPLHGGGGRGGVRAGDTRWGHTTLYEGCARGVRVTRVGAHRSRPAILPLHATPLPRHPPGLGGDVGGSGRRRGGASPCRCPCPHRRRRRRMPPALPRP
jgi:hypothetical protein